METQNINIKELINEVKRLKKENKKLNSILNKINGVVNSGNKAGLKLNSNICRNENIT